MHNIRPWREPEINDDPISEYLHSIAIFARAIEKKLSERLGVNMTDFAAMEHLITNLRLTPSELAAHLHVTTAAGTQIVDRLERVGHVSRERQSDDRRKVLIVPNPASAEQVFHELAPLSGGLQTIVAALSPADRQVIEHFLREVVSVYRTALESSDTPVTPAAPPAAAE